MTRRKLLSTALSGVAAPFVPPVPVPIHYPGWNVIVVFDEGHSEMILIQQQLIRDVQIATGIPKELI